MIEIGSSQTSPCKNIGRKANFGTLLTVLLGGVIGLFIIGIVAVHLFGFLGDYRDDKVAENNTYVGENSSFDETVTQTTTGADVIVPLIAAVLYTSIIIVAWFTDAHPFLFIILFLLIVAIIYAGGVLSNAWEEDMIKNPSLETTFPKTNFLFENYAMVATAMTLSALAITYIRRKTAI